MQPRTAGVTDDEKDCVSASKSLTGRDYDRQATEMWELCYA